MSDVERQEIAEIAKRHEHRRAAVVEALKCVQARRRWIDDASLVAIAAQLDLTTAEVEGIATAYDRIFRRPVGRHVILLCDSVSCSLTGYDGLRTHLRQTLGLEFGQTTADGRFTLLPVACLGACDLAPAMVIDDDLHGRLTPAKIDEILTCYA